MTKIHSCEKSKNAPKKTITLFADDVPCPKCNSIKITLMGGGSLDGIHDQFELTCQNCNHIWIHKIV